ncbi:MAG: hypothetical protein ACFN4U_02505 [Candidatus Absconditicoccaceae bacterium]
MKKNLIGVFLLCCMLFSGCGAKSQDEAVDEKPELAPICPEGFYWVDSIKSCTLILDE